MNILSEFRFEFNEHGAPTFENINMLIKTISYENQKQHEDEKFHYIILLDEIRFNFTDHDLTLLELDEPDIDLHFAINPNVFKGESHGDLPNHPNTYSVKLISKHRNSLQICLFLSHLATSYSKSYPLSPISDEEDEPLVNSCFSSNQKPVWIMAQYTMTDEEILDGIQREQILPNCGRVTLLHNLSTEEQQRRQRIAAWCKDREWNCIEGYEMDGSESSVVVAYDLIFSGIESYSRAKHHLIIVTRYAIQIF